MSCSVCPRNCKSRQSGFCGVGENIIVGRIAPHMWEEPVISGKNGSGTVFFSGCNLRCVFCQNRVISKELVGKAVSPEELNDKICHMIESGVHNINFVTPTHYASFLADFLSRYHYPVPIVYNCSGYESVSSLEALRGKVDIFLPDFKYSDDAPAVRYSSAPHYVHTARMALEKMYELVGDTVFDSNGMLTKGIIVRHLMLPGHIENTLGVIDMFEEFSRHKKVLFSLMSQYTPCGDMSAFDTLNRKLTAQEYDKALGYLELLGIDGFCQELSSAAQIYIPPFGNQL
ncbi:MAG: radical SAM protein [Clostridia bacterium]|nr:radical SAM protein [Clostridia bacterium]